MSVCNVYINMYVLILCIHYFTAVKSRIYFKPHRLKTTSMLLAIQYVLLRRFYFFFIFLWLVFSFDFRFILMHLLLFWIVCSIWTFFRRKKPNAHKSANYFSFILKQWKFSKFSKKKKKIVYSVLVSWIFDTLLNAKTNCHRR